MTSIGRWKMYLAAISGVWAVSIGSPARCDDGNLVANGDFANRDSRGMPASWSPWLPEVSKAACRLRAGAEGLLIDAPGRPYGVGGMRQDIRRVQAGRTYAIEATCKTEGVPSPYRSLLVRLTWTRAGQPLQPAGMYVHGPLLAKAPELSSAASTSRPSSGAGDPTGTSPEFVFRDFLVAPQGADAANISLEVKWPQGGSVLWKRVCVRPAAPRPPRKVKIGTVYLRPKESTPQRNLKLFCGQIDAAGKLGLDIVCLPEAITVVGTGYSGPQLAERIPGPSTDELGAAARRNRIWVVAGLYERDRDLVYNSAILLDREGRLAGKYRKIHLPREEWQKGITPGGEYPVFKTEFGTIAIQVCYDAFFPEMDGILGLQGAEIVFAPTWGTTFADQAGRVEGENMFRVRARDNGIYLVPSVYDGSSMVIDPMGRVLASNRGREGVFWCEVDLNVREPLEWVGYWRAIGPRDRMPTTYDALLADPALKTQDTK